MNRKLDFFLSTTLKWVGTEPEDLRRLTQNLSDGLRAVAEALSGYLDAAPGLAAAGVATGAGELLGLLAQREHRLPQRRRLATFTTTSPPPSLHSTSIFAFGRIYPLEDP